MAAQRTQIYLTKDQRAKIDRIRRREGKSLAEVVRDAVDAYEDEPEVDLQAALDATFGAIPDLSVPPRDEWDRARPT
jgi:Ribbon-helix-helix protein, copG family